MDLRKLVMGLTALAHVGRPFVGLLAPGGRFNRGETEKAEVKIPLDPLEIVAREAKTSAWPTVGYVLLTLGGVGVVALLSMKSSVSST